MVTNENKVDFTILRNLRRTPPGTSNNEPRNEDETPHTAENEPRNAPEPGQAEEPRGIRTLSEEQQTYIDRIKAEILTQIYTVDDTPGLLLKAIGAMCVALNDKAYYNQVTRLIKNIWGQGLGKIRTLEEIPGEFTLAELQHYICTLKDDLREKQLDTFARVDIEKAISYLTEKGKAIFKSLPDASKGNYEAFKS